ncbi:MAG TPA: AraC family transcriptional regulator, partial [Thermoanaerobaculia bacterium]
MRDDCNLRRCEAAKRLVAVANAPLSTIAAGLGFSDAELFSKWFKGQTGQSPRQHREASRPASPPDAQPPTTARLGPPGSDRVLRPDLHLGVEYVRISPASTPSCRP